MAVTEARWKAAERRIATALGGRRIPVSGRARGDQPDIRHDWLSVEVKTRKQLPSWLEQAVRQAEASAGVSQLPIAVLHQVGARGGLDLVVLRLSEWRAWFGDG